MQLQELQLTEGTHAADITLQKVIVQVQLGQVDQIVEFYWDGPSQLIEVQIDENQIL